MNFADRKQSVILSIFLFNSYSLTFLIPYAYSVLFSIQFFTTFFLCFTAQNNLRIVIYLTLICMFTFWLYMSFFNIVIKSTFSIVKITCIKLHIRLHFFLFVQSNRKIHNYLCNYFEQCIYYHISSLISPFSCQTQAPRLVYHLFYFTLIVLSFFNLVTIFPIYFCLFLCTFLISFLDISTIPVTISSIAIPLLHLGTLSYFVFPFYLPLSSFCSFFLYYSSDVLSVPDLYHLL